MSETLPTCRVRAARTCTLPQSLTLIHGNLQVMHSQTTCEACWSSMLWPTRTVCVAVLMGQFSTDDHGSVYTSQAFRNYCSSLGVRQSMGAVGTSADNALAESFNATLKREVLRDRKVFDNPIICRQEVFRWCMRYNTRRRHSWCNLLAPDDFEALTSATLTQAA